MPTRKTTTIPDVIQLTVADGNWSDSSQRGPIHSIVLHTIVGTIDGANARFNNPASKVSAHYGVGLDGKIYQWCDEDNVAYHAGDWIVNQTSIGIEHEDGTNPETNPQGFNSPRPDTLYLSSAKLVAEICRFYDFPADKEHIFRHQDVIDKSVYPGGTSCPDSLDTDRIIQMANEILNPPAAVETTTTMPATTTQIIVEMPKVDQTDTNSVKNEPVQTPIKAEEPVVSVSGQMGKVPPQPKVTFRLSGQHLSIILNWIKRLLVRFLSIFGIDVL